MIRALILDLDNTIYPVSSIAAHLFTGLFSLVDQMAGEFDQDTIEKIKEEFTRRPYQHVAEKYQFSKALTESGLDLLNHITYDLPMQPYPGYQHLRDIPIEKFLVTTGFIKLQTSKVKMLGIENDFKEIHIVDPATGVKTKQHVFAELMERFHYQPEELLVIGDDPESEIKVASGLGIPTFLFDPDNQHHNTTTTYKSASLKKIASSITAMRNR